nr:glutamate receptor ionotropic, kainate 2-like [Cherax quadricarinatus]
MKIIPLAEKFVFAAIVCVEFVQTSQVLVVKAGLTTQVVNTGVATQMMEAGLTKLGVKAKLTSQVMIAGLTTQVVEAVLSSASHGSSSVALITDGTVSSFTVVKLQQISSYMTVVVMSDDSAFLAAFVELSLKLHILVWSTRLLIVTRSHIKELQDHQAILSKTNSVLVVINEDTANASLLECEGGSNRGGSKLDKSECDKINEAARENVDMTVGEDDGGGGDVEFIDEIETDDTKPGELDGVEEPQTVTPLMSEVVWYVQADFERKTVRVSESFFAFIQITQKDAESLVEDILKQLEKDELELQDSSCCHLCTTQIYFNMFYYRCSVYVYLPYSPRGVKPLQVASWTPHRGLVFTSSLPLFPDKFSKFSSRFWGTARGLLSEALNFHYSYVRPPDGEGGIKLNNGSWSGMVGMVMRQEVDIGAGPYMIDRWRAEVVDFTVPILIDYWRILAARGRPEVDPWGFLFPLTPLVWAAILAALMVLATLVFLMSSSVFNRIHEQRNWLQVTFVYVRILLQQDMAVPICWWERVMLLVWIMVTLVLTRSYAGNLMALLAVRHISQPYQTLRDVVDDPSVTMIWSKGSAVGPYLKSAESGIYRDIADAEKVGRLIWKAHPQFPEVIDTLVRRGDHVLIEVDTPIRDYLAQDFTKTGQCYFYESREEFLKIMFAMIGPKDSPLVPALNKRIMSMTEAGLFFQWLKIEEKNSTTCYRAPNKITVNMALSISNVWGMFVILIMGYFLSVCVFCLELLIHRLPQQVQKFPHEHNF